MTRERPGTHIHALRDDAATGRFSLRGSPANAAGRLVQIQQVGHGGRVTLSDLPPEALDLFGLSVVSVVDAMQHPGEWRAALGRVSAPGAFTSHQDGGGADD